MELSADAKAVILNYLKDGQQEMAVQYVSQHFHISLYDSQKLVETVAREFSHELKGVLPRKKPDARSCSGCLSAILKVISVLLILAGAGVFALGYFFFDLFSSQWNNRPVPVVVTDLEYIYADSLYAHAIIQFEIDGQARMDTSLLDYNTQYTHVGDTINMKANDLGLPLDADTIARMKKQQRFIYSIAGSVLLAAVIFWLVAVVFKVRPPSTEGGRYSK